MFDIGAPELLILVVIAVIVFGPDRLPQLARKAAHALRYVRTLAGNAQGQLKKELGPDFDDVDFRDLNPKAFVTKHLLADVQPMVDEMKDEVKSLGSLGKDTVTEATAAIDDAKRTARATKTVTTGNGVTATVAPALAGPRIRTPYDPDAT